MADFLKTFIKDLSGPGPIVLKKYVLPPLFLFFVWGLTSSIIILNKNLSDLNKTSGTVEDYFIRREVAGRGNVTHPLYIKLIEHKSLYRIKDSYSSIHDELMSQIVRGDSLHIYTLNEQEAEALWGKTHDVFQLENDTVLFSLEKVTEAQYNQIYFNIAFLLLTPLTYLLILKKYPNI
ncbi:MAG: hypothetical protein ACJAZ2_002230 [Glaciecola sp.]|jgi:hypothetical protein